MNRTRTTLLAALIAGSAIACDFVAPTLELATTPRYGTESCDTVELRACMQRESRCAEETDPATCRVEASACVEIELYDQSDCLTALGCSHGAEHQRCLANCEAIAQECVGDEDFATVERCYNARFACARRCPDQTWRCP